MIGIYVILKMDKEVTERIERLYTTNMINMGIKSNILPEVFGKIAAKKIRYGVTYNKEAEDIFAKVTEYIRNDNGKLIP